MSFCITTVKEYYNNITFRLFIVSFYIAIRNELIIVCYTKRPNNQNDKFYIEIKQLLVN